MAVISKFGEKKRAAQASAASSIARSDARPSEAFLVRSLRRRLEDERFARDLGLRLTYAQLTRQRAGSDDG